MQYYLDAELADPLGEDCEFVDANRDFRESIEFAEFDVRPDIPEKTRARVRQIWAVFQ